NGALCTALLFTPLKKISESLIKYGRKTQHASLIKGIDGIQNKAAHLIFPLAGHLQRNPGTVGHAQQVPLVVGQQVQQRTNILRMSQGSVVVWIKRLRRLAQLRKTLLEYRVALAQFFQHADRSEERRVG